MRFRWDLYMPWFFLADLCIVAATCVVVCYFCFR